MMLFEHSLRGGIVPRKGNGRVHFKHYTEVSCTQQQDSVGATGQRVMWLPSLLPYGHICEGAEEFKQKY
jgi:hypothetical protein